MSLRSLALPDDVTGRLWLAPMPGRHESWPSFLREADSAGVTLLVCLTPRHEMASHSRDYANAVTTGQLPFEWMNLAMRDFGLATDDKAFAAGIETIARSLRDGGHVVLHCAAGIGRTGTAAACVLKRLGLSREAAVSQVRTAGSNPESAVQSGLIDHF